MTADGAALAIVSVREGAAWLIWTEATTGELTALWRAPLAGSGRAEVSFAAAHAKRLPVGAAYSAR